MLGGGGASQRQPRAGGLHACRQVASSTACQPLLHLTHHAPVRQAHGDVGYLSGSHARAGCMKRGVPMGNLHLPRSPTPAIPHPRTSPTTHLCQAHGDVGHLSGSHAQQAPQPARSRSRPCCCSQLGARPCRQACMTVQVGDRNSASKMLEHEAGTGCPCCSQLEARPCRFQGGPSSNSPPHLQHRSPDVWCAEAGVEGWVCSTPVDGQRKPSPQPPPLHYTWRHPSWRQGGTSVRLVRATVWGACNTQSGGTNR